MAEDTTTTTADTAATTAAAAATTAAATTATATTAAATTAAAATTTTTEAAKPIWPDNWRKEMAGTEDEKEISQLGRYATPADVWRKARELEKQFSSGEYRKVNPFPEKGTPEEQTAWRKANGIPEAPDKYEIKLKDGKPLADADKAQVESFAKLAHSLNMAPAHVNAAVQWMADQTAQQAQEDAEQDAAEQKTYEDAQRAKWGTEYRRNENLINGLLDKAPQGVKDLLLKSRLADGTLVKNHPGMADFLVALALEINPQGTVVPNSTGNIGSAVDDEIKKIEGWMAAPKGSPDSNKYWKDDKAQSRYRELLDWRNNQKRAA